MKETANGVIPQIGDIFYMIVPQESKSFTKPCRVCGGTKSLTINEVTFRCPCCQQEEAILRVCGYKVVRFKVYAGETRCVDYDNWKLPTNRDGSINVKKTYRLFTKHGKGYEWKGVKTVDKYEGYFENSKLNSVLDVNSYPIEDPIHWHCDALLTDLLYSDYKLACKIADDFSKAQMKRVEVYNKMNGTDFPVPYLVQEHDKKCY